MDWPHVSRMSRLGAAKFLGELANLEAIHLEFQRAERNAEIPRRGRHVPTGFFERAQDEVTLERVRGFLEQAFALRRHAIELGEMELERQILVRNPLLVADRDEPLDQILELADVAGPPVT